MPPEATQADIAIARTALGLDKPLPVQYWVFISNAVQGNFGRSLRFGRPALDMVKERYPNTLLLGSIALLIALSIALPVGVYSAVHRGTALDYFSRGMAAFGQAVPPFWLGLVLILIFGVIFHVLPTSGIGTPAHLVLPAFTLGWFAVAGLTRLTRSSMLDVLGAEFIKLARQLGLDAVFVNISFVGSNALARELGKDGEGVVITQVVPFPGDSSIPLVAEYQRAVRSADPRAEFGFVSLEGYMVGRLVVQALGRTGEPVTRAGLLATFEEVGTFDLGGFTLSYGPGDNQGSDRVFLTVIRADGSIAPVARLAA
jgi:hypothetical protein